jgi:putative transposase
VGRVLSHLLQLRRHCLDILHACFLRCTKPLSSSLPLGTLADLGRSKSQLITENALLRQQLIILSRQVKRPTYRKADRLLLLLLARLVRNWKQALLIVQPDTLLRWHRELFRLVWKRKSKAASHTPKIPAETVALIREMAAKNRLWGAERIRGELLKLGIHVCKRTIQQYMRPVRTPQPSSKPFGVSRIKI